MRWGGGHAYKAKFVFFPKNKTSKIVAYFVVMTRSTDLNGACKLMNMRPRKSETEFLPKFRGLVTFRVRGTVGKQRLRQTELVEFVSLQQTVLNFPERTELHFLSTRATRGFN